MDVAVRETFPTAGQDFSGNFELLHAYNSKKTKTHTRLDGQYRDKVKERVIFRGKNLLNNEGSFEHIDDVRNAILFSLIGPASTTPSIQWLIYVKKD